MELVKAIENRRSMYSISDEKIVPEETIIDAVGHSMLHCPSSYNLQQGRAIVLFGADHARLWDIVFETLRPIVKPERIEATQTKIASFKAGYGTVLFFNDRQAVEDLSAKFPSYATRFPDWAAQSNGMLQYIVWTHLESLGLGCSLQHYNPLIDEAVRNAWQVPTGWDLISQMPFGKPTAPSGKKAFMPLEQRLKVYGG